jgi:hypothetical protein
MLLERWDIFPVLRVGAESRLESVEDCVARRPDIFRAALGFGIVIADGLTSRTRVLDYIEGPARGWGIDTDGSLEFWNDFRLSLSRINKQLGMDHDSELDRLIVTSKTDYL